MKKRFFSILMALALCLTLLPTAALAGGTDDTGGAPTGTPLTQELIEKRKGSDKSEGIQLLAGDYYLTENVYLVGDDTGAWSLSLGGATDDAFTLDLNGYVLDLRGANICAFRNLTLKDSNTGNQSHKFRVEESGLWVWDETAGTETVTGGVITGGKGAENSNGIGGGVYINSGKTFTMNGGSIVGCTAAAGNATGTFSGIGGGGVYIGGSSGSFTMTGGRIVGCTAGGAGGGGVYIGTGSSFTMEGGSIESCTASDSGGGVYSAGSFTMAGGSIERCTAANGGGVYSEANFTMNDGRIAGCTAANGDGGGVLSDDNFTMEGGSIEDCTAANGGGVSIADSKTFTMTGGSIVGCTAAQAGGGVIVKKGTNNEGTFTMSGGSISGCKAGGVDNAVHADGTLTFENGTSIDESLLSGINGGQTGQANDPILIGSAEGLKDFRDKVNGGEKALCAKLVCDIVLNDGTFDEDGRYKNAAGQISTPAQWTPIGSSISNPYKGTFDGGGKTIKGLYVTGEWEYAGLFGYTEDATIQNVTVDGYVSASGDVTDEYGSTSVGGIVGCANNTTITGCTNLCTVKSDCTSVEAGSYAGGIAGNVTSSVDGRSVTECRNSGKVILMANYDGLNVGGIAGSSNVIVSNCYNTGGIEVTSDYAAHNWLCVGGVVGQDGTGGAQVSNCYNTGTVTVTGTYTIDPGASIVGFGGVVGVFIGTVSKCYNTGKVTCDNDNAIVGGVAGVNHDATVTDCYFLTDTAATGVGKIIGSGTTNFDGKTKAQFANGDVLGLLKQNDTTDAWGVNGYLEAAKMTLPLLNWQTADDHTHSVQTGICTEGIKCACGYEMYAPTSGHNWGEWVHDTTSHRRGCDNPGCGMTQSGNCSGGTATCKEQATCTVCGGKYGALADHSFTAENTDEQYLKTAATCTAKAVYYKSCAVCGLSSKDTDDEATFESGEVDASSHTGGLGSWQSNAEKHWKEYSCCGAKAEEADHVYTDAADTTCNTCGYQRAVHYAITFNANGGTLASGEETQQTNAVGKLTSLPTPTRSGSYRFDGWYTEKSGGTRVTTETVFKADTTVYAHWIYTGGSGSYMPTYAVTVEKSTNGSVSADRKTASRGTTVTITVTPDKGYTLETITVLDKDGKEVKITETNGKYTFTMPASSVTVKATFMDDNTMLNFFVDVKSSDYYYDAVLWAAQNGITSGTDAVHFSPSLPCTRAQTVTFLWRAAGSPVVNYAMNMTDVPEDAYYAEAVRWALSEGITTGTTATTFSPNETCTRAQAVAFLFRYAAPAAVTLQELVSGFSDAASVPGYALSAMNWALADGIVQGSGTKLMPNDFCTRAQIVTFLYRALEK